MIIPEPRNKVQITASIDRGVDGSVIRTSLVINIREQSVGGAVELYKQLQKELGVGGGNVVALIADGSGNTSNQLNGKEISIVPKCPTHHTQMLLRTRKSDGQMFFGCQQFMSGCKETIPYPV